MAAELQASFGGLFHVYLGEGEITPDPIADDFFGCAGVARISNLQQKLRVIGKTGYRHHVSLTFGNHEPALREAFENYLGYTFTELPASCADR